MAHGTGILACIDFQWSALGHMSFARPMAVFAADAGMYGSRPGRIFILVAGVTGRRISVAERLACPFLAVVTAFVETERGEWSLGWNESGNDEDENDDGKKHPCGSHQMFHWQVSIPLAGFQARFEAGPSSLPRH